MDTIKYKVLVAEEDDYLREKISGILSRQSEAVMVTQVNCFDSLKKTVEQMAPDIVFLDERLSYDDNSDISCIKKHLAKGVLILTTEERNTRKMKRAWALACDYSVVKEDIFKGFEKACCILRQKTHKEQKLKP